MDDIFKSKDDMQREEKINNLFKSSGDFKREKPQTASEEEVVAVAETGKKGRKVFLSILLVLLFLGLAGAAGYFFWQYKKALAISKTITASDEAQAVAEKVKAFMELPEWEPALTTITNQEKLADQPFFPNALEGDKILIYIQSKKAILYRPYSNELIGTISLLSSQSAETETKAVAENTEKIESKVKVDVLNGTEIKGLAKETADKLSGMENVELAKVGNAQKSDYAKILVVDLSGKNAVAAKIIAQKLGGEVGTLPAGESKGTVDILVIAGKWWITLNYKIAIFCHAELVSASNFGFIG